MTNRIHDLLTQLTLEEKASLTAGDSLWQLTAIPRVGLPPMKVTDGPNGARGNMEGGMTSACFPGGAALGATWDVELIQRVGEELARETRAKGASVLLAPTINMHRTPLNGRNFECYAEDPFLTGKLAAAYIRGLQSQQVAACPKHYVCNDSEFQRMTLDVLVDERTLREIYLLPFEMAVKEGGAWAVMAAYNMVNGEFAAASSFLLQQVLKGEWGFDGLVMSDWFGTKSTVGCFEGGLDLEMPGPGFMLGRTLADRVRTGELAEDILVDKVRRYLRLAERTGAMDQDGIPPETSRDDPDTREIAYQAAAASLVLLKNDHDVLPLPAKQLDSLAVIGPNARIGSIMGGGSAMVNAPYQCHPLQSIQDLVADTTEIRFEQGCTNHRYCPILETAMLGSQDGQPGVQVEYFNNHALEGDPVATELRDSTQLLWFGGLPDQVQPGFAARITLEFQPTASGVHEFGLITVGRARMKIEGDTVINHWEEFEQGETFFGMGSTEKTFRRHFATGTSTVLTLEFACQPGSPIGVLRLGVVPPLPDDAIARAARAAAQADAAIVVVGLNQDWEGEGHDRSHMDLSGRQDELVSAVAAQNPHTVVVVNAGAPVTMPWLDEVAAVLYAWYPGQEFGRALADVLFGEVNPAGRLPLTLPQRLQDTPGYVNYPGERGQVRYGEGIFVGYRHYDVRDVEPLFPFGHGLSYTSFAYSNFTLDGDVHSGTGILRVGVDVRNTGHLPGDEVVQLYVGQPDAAIARPVRELKGFRRLHLGPEEQMHVEFSVSGRDLGYFDVRAREWKADAGTYCLEVGASSRDIRLRHEYDLAPGWQESRFAPGQALTLDTPLPLVMLRCGERMMGAMGLLAHMPQVMMIWGYAMTEGLSLRDMSRFLPDTFTEARLAEWEALLAQV